MQALIGMASFFATAITLPGCNMSNKANIKSFGKTFQYLKDPDLRLKETNDAPLTIRSAFFNGVNFQGQTWRNVNFVDCDFAGAYEIKLAAMEKCLFEKCKILGVHDFGAMSDVHFFKCLSGSSSNWGGNKGSKNVLFEDCQFIGETEDRNHQGAIGTYGEATFIRCKIKWFDISADTGLIAKDCEFDDVSFHPKIARGSANVVIENCKLRGIFNMVPASFESLTIRDTIIDNLDLSGANVTGDVLMERVRGGVIKAGLTARSFTLRNSEIFGPGQVIFELGIDSMEEVLIENVSFGTSLTTQVGLGAGRPLKASEWRSTPRTKTAVIKNCTLPIVDASWLESQHLRLEGNQIGSLNLSDGRIWQLELSGNTIARGVDFTNTQVKVSKVQTLAKSQATLNGSNVKIN